MPYSVLSAPLLWPGQCWRSIRPPMSRTLCVLLRRLCPLVLLGDRGLRSAPGHRTSGALEAEGDGCGTKLVQAPGLVMEFLSLGDIGEGKPHPVCHDGEAALHFGDIPH